MEALLLSILTVIGILLSVVGSFVPGWFIYADEFGFRVQHGLWYKIACMNSCVTVALKDAEPFREVQYALQVELQILSTIANVAGITGSVFVILGYKSSKFSKVFKEMSTRCFIAMFALKWRVIGLIAIEMQKVREVYEQLNSDFQIGVPYGLIMSALGSGLLFCIGIFYFISSKRKTSMPVYQEIHTIENREFKKTFYSKTLLVILFVLSAVGLLLQLVGFASPGWDIRLEKYNGLIHTGLWYRVHCSTDPSMDCKVESLYHFFQERIETVSKFYAIDYGLLVGNEVCATLSLVATLWTVMFGMMVLIKTERSTLLLNFTEISCLISVLLNWPVIGKIVGKTEAQKRDEAIFGHTNTTYIFPYSAFLSALGSTVLLVIYTIHTLKYFMLLYRIQTKQEASTANETIECNRM